jgi:hypothetical protein
MWGGSFQNLGGIGLAEEQADRLLAVPINHSDVRFASHCRRSADIELSPESANTGSPLSPSVARHPLLA